MVDRCSCCRRCGATIPCSSSERDECQGSCFCGVTEDRENISRDQIMNDGLLTQPTTILDMDDRQLVAECERLAKARHAGMCDYCGRRYNAPACAKPERHAMAGAQWWNDWHVEFGSTYLTARRDRYNLTIARYSGADGFRVFLFLDNDGIANANLLPMCDDPDDMELFRMACNWADNKLMMEQSQ